MTRTTDLLNDLQDHAARPHPVPGIPTRIWAANLVVVHPDGTVDIEPVQSRAVKNGVQVPNWYKPHVGDQVLACDLNGNQQTPIVICPLAITIPTVTGSRSGGAALTSLLTALASWGLIINNTTS